MIDTVNPGVMGPGPSPSAIEIQITHDLLHSMSHNQTLALKTSPWNTPKLPCLSQNSVSTCGECTWSTTHSLASHNSVRRENIGLCEAVSKCYKTYGILYPTVWGSSTQLHMQCCQHSMTTCLSLQQVLGSLLQLRFRRSRASKSASEFGAKLSTFYTYSSQLVNLH